MATDRPKAGEVETRHNEIATEGRKIRGVVPYGVESRDMGGWREVIDPGALRQANLDDLVARVDHAGVPIGRFPKTLDVEDRADGLHWSVIPPESRADLREAIERGDLRAGSWQMVVAKDRWSGDTRHVEQIAELRDVSVVSAPAYPAAAVEYRSAPKPITEEETKVEAEEKVEERATASSEEEKQPEVRVTNEPEPILQVEDRSGGPMFESLTDAFRQRGFPGETATISWGEFRAASFAGTIPSLNPIYRDGIPLGADQRYAFPAFRQVAVDSATTSVQVLRQTVRTLPAGTAVVRAIDAVTAKPEVTTTTDVATMELKQIAAVETNVPNIVLGQDMIQSLVETDLRLSVNEGLDQLVATGLATSGTMSAGTLDILTNVRKAITTVTAAGYVPSDLIIDPGGRRGDRPLPQFGVGALLHLRRWALRSR
jgi:HK97 family phage prohead protease